MPKAPMNRSMTLTNKERDRYRKKLLKLSAPASPKKIIGRVINQDLFEVLDLLPERFVDLLFIDPPYNLTKSFNRRSFKKLSTAAYMEWMESWLPALSRTLKPDASIYICGDWRSSAAIHLLGEKHFKIINRITFEREKGRGAGRHWKNASEDIWFMANSTKHYFDPDAVKLKRRVLAPYREGGAPKGWQREDGGDFRLTHPSNLWTDITIPFWSMAENTPHPTQKPEKLLAKIILASSKQGDVVLDPFAGVGTAAVVAKKLGRRFAAIEIDEDYCLHAMKRLARAEADSSIQGFADGVFWERNAFPHRGRGPRTPK